MTQDMIEWWHCSNGALGTIGGLTHFAIIIWGDGTVRWNKLGTKPKTAKSMEDAKQLCQQHWESEAGIGKFLERVQ